MKFSNSPALVKLPANKLFELTGNCKNFPQYLSEQAKDIHATEDSCSFILENIAKISLKILEKKPCSLVRFVAENDKNIPLFIDFNFAEVSENETNMEISLDIDIPIFLRPMLQKPLERFVEILSQKVKTEAEKTYL